MTTPPPARRDSWNRWLGLWAVLGSPGVGMAVLGWGAATVAGVAAVLATSAVSILLLSRVDRPGSAVNPPGVGPMPLARTAGCVSALGVSMLAVATVLPALLLLVVPAQLLSLPPATDRWWRHRTRREPAPTPPPREREEPRDEREDEREDEVDTARRSRTATVELLGQMDDRGLCRSWRHSYWVLRETATTSETMALVILRECLLDELGRRDPGAVEAWFRAGARASGGPDRYMDGGPDGSRPDGRG